MDPIPSKGDCSNENKIERFIRPKGQTSFALLVDTEMTNDTCAKQLCTPSRVLLLEAAQLTESSASAEK